MSTQQPQFNLVMCVDGNRTRLYQCMEEEDITDVLVNLPEALANDGFSNITYDPTSRRVEAAKGGCSFLYFPEVVK